MGLFLRTNMFRGVDQEQVYAALEQFWSQERHHLEDDQSPGADSYALHEQHNGWTVLNWTKGWEWDLRRRAQLHVSRVLDCSGLLTFVYDGDLWGYELFHHGQVVDRFLQWTDTGPKFFGDLPCQGAPDVLVAQFPELGLNVRHARAYLTSISADDPRYEDFAWDEYDPRNQPARDGDRWGRLEPAAIYDFWRYLGVETHRANHRYTPTAPIWRRFTTAPV
ncbi:hypothetical protein DN069_12870 [Streptacidiphilus pinicola]|uniref:Uncharacterized protein n=1 Tax=Streptacidiphilus pinicola TaxID=2219663 RepID=A0A2X0IPY7_9ACTN|nr:hypothetical protein [Streptacidiphilus pinicola]RAG85251.1 hypothetical protein DN069_12870 [Streptacidiphilus pinicola]